MILGLIFALIICATNGSSESSTTTTTESAFQPLLQIAEIRLLRGKRAL
jgi:hypothetical protein